MGSSRPAAGGLSVPVRHQASVATWMRGDALARAPSCQAAPVPEPCVLHVIEAIEAGVARHVADVVAHANGIEHHVASPAVRVGWTTDHAAKEATRAAGAEIHHVDMRR